MTATEVQKRLRSVADPALAAECLRFYKKEHAANSTFLGLRAATVRAAAKEFRTLPLAQVEKLLHSRAHEDRSTALIILGHHVHRAAAAIRKEVYDLYLANTPYINNWDLVDVSAPGIVGGYLIDKSRTPLHQLARSEVLWERRIAIVATQFFIRQEDFADTLTVSRMLLADKEDLIHKAAGWMLREVGKRDLPTLEGFLGEHARTMPRTMLRYAIERFPDGKRKAYLQK